MRSVTKAVVLLAIVSLSLVGSHTAYTTTYTILAPAQTI